MSTSQLTTSPPRPSFFRTRLPWLIVAGGVLFSLAVWIWPTDLERADRVVGITWFIAPLTVLLLGLWVLFFSGWSWGARAATLLGAPLLLGTMALAAVREVRMTGDMVPQLTFRWSRTADEVREAHRQAAGAVAWSPGVLSGDQAGDHAEYRGKHRDGVVQGPALARDWKAQPPRLVWRQPVGGGHAGFAIAGNAVVTIEQRRDAEAVVCYDTDTGQEVWQFAYPALFTEPLGGIGPRATPTIADGAVYALGAEGHLTCLDAATGKKKWQVNILDGTKNLKWAMSGSPLVYDNVVVVNPGAQTDDAQGRALTAYDRANGALVWKAGGAKAGYSSPMLATLAGRRQVLLFDGDGLAGHDAGNGAELWRYAWPTHMGINAAQPVVLDGDRVYISSGYDAGGVMLQVAEKDGKRTAEPLWRNKSLRCKFTSPVLRDGHLYGLDDGVLVCLNAETGKRTWRGQRYGHGQLLRSDDLLLILGESGELALVEATPEAFRERGNIPALEGKTWNYPALAGGRVYLRNDQEMACYDLTAPPAARTEE